MTSLLPNALPMPHAAYISACAGIVLLCATLLQPFMPSFTRKVMEQLGVSEVSREQPAGFACLEMQHGWLCDPGPDVPAPHFWAWPSPAINRLQCKAHQVYV